METICNTCILNAGCGFVKLSPKSIVKCNSYMNSNLSREALMEVMNEFMANPIALTMNDIELEEEGGN